MANCIEFKKNLNIYCGGTLDKSYSWSVESTPVNLTGYTGEMVIKDKIGGRTLLTITNQSSSWVSDGSTGIYITPSNWRIYINEIQTISLNRLSKNYIATYNLFLTNASGEVVLKQHGNVSVIV